MQSSLSILNRNIRSFFCLISLTHKDANQGLSQMFFDIFITTIRFGLLLVIYSYVFSLKGDKINGETFATVAYSIFMYFWFMNINPRYVSRAMQNMIRTGAIQDLFTKPVNLISYIISQYIGSRLQIFFIVTFLGFPIMFTFFSVPDNFYSLFFWLTFLLTFLFCFILSNLIYISIGMLAFWLEEITPINWIIDKFVMVLGGAYLPVTMLPIFMQKFALWSPFGASQFVTSTVNRSWLLNYNFYLAMQIFWIFIFSLVLFSLVKLAEKKVVTNGG